MIDDDFDPFVFAPSFQLAESLEAGGELFEGKAIGTAKLQDLKLMQNIASFPYTLAPNANTEAKKGQTVGRRKMLEVQQRTKAALLSLILNFQSKKISESEFRKSATKTMKTAWRDVYLAGIRASGVSGTGAGKGKVLVNLHAMDEGWLKGAMSHEMSFLNGFLEDIVTDSYKMPLERRAEMYVRALTSFYESARVIGMPENVLIHWAGPGDKKTCLSCRYLFENSPYTKLNLPTTPRAGMTLCLTNCRDRLFVRRVDLKEVQTRLEESKYTRGGHVANLRRIKRTGSL